jgi:IS5 family transposase
VEFSVAPASQTDVKVLKEMDLELPEGATIHADKGYTDYRYEDLLQEVGVKLHSLRKKGSKRPHSACTQFLAKPISCPTQTSYLACTDGTTPSTAKPS